MRTTGIMASICIILAALITFTALVSGFSMAPRMVLEGWRNVDRHTSFRNHGSTQQLYMSEKGNEDGNSDDISAVETIDDIINVSVLSQEDAVGESEDEADAIDETEDVDENLVMDTNAIEEEEEPAAGSEVEAVDVDEQVQEEIQAEEVEADEEESEIVAEIEEVEEKEEEEIVEDDSDEESETVAIATDETEQGKKKEDEDTMKEDDDDEIEAAAEETKEEDSVVADDEDVEEVANEEGDESDESVALDENNHEEEKEETIEASALDDSDEGQEDDSEDAIVETTVYLGNQDNPDSTSIDKSQEAQEDDRKGLNLELVAVVAGDIAKDVLSLLRFGAANFLTASLPENQRQDLLKRMGATALPPASERAEEVKEAAEEIVAQKIEAERASIQEEIAIARAEEAQKSENKWKREKEEILQEMDEAASARVENELKIQKMKLEEETAKSLLEKEQTLLAEKERLEKAIEEEREKLEALEAEKANEVEGLFAVKTDEELARNEELEALIEKRRQQQAALDSIEEELRASVANEEEQRAQLNAMLEKRQVQQQELNSVEASLRDQVKEIESEKARYQQLVDGLDAMKKKAQELQQDGKEISGDSSDNGDAESVDDDEIEIEPDHPVLGPVIVDLGYKRMHLVSAGKLGTIPVWNRNRIYRNNRAKSMAAEKIKSMELGFPGVIGLHEASSGKLSIVDGQHRVGMMAALKEKMNKMIEKGDGSFDETYDIFDKVMVEVYPEPESSAPADDAFAEMMFLEINKAEPVKLIDMPGVASAADRQVITEAVESLQDQFGAMFSSSQRCRVPNVNVDNLRSVIFGANILKRHKLTTSSKLLEWLLQQNAALGDEYENNTTKQKLVSKKQWTKASANNFYLGLESSWLYK